MTIQEQAESLIDNHTIDENGFLLHEPSTIELEDIYGDEYSYSKSKAKYHAISEVQSKIELLEELLDKTFNVYEQELWFIGNIRTRLNQQKEILKYLEEL